MAARRWHMPEEDRGPRHHPALGAPRHEFLAGKLGAPVNAQRVGSIGLNIGARPAVEDVFTGQVDEARPDTLARPHHILRTAHVDDPRAFWVPLAAVDVS